MLVLFASLNAIDGICCPDGCTHEQASTSQQHDRESSDGSCVLCLGGVESAVPQTPSASGIVTNRFALPPVHSSPRRAGGPTRPPSALITIPDYSTRVETTDGLVRTDAPAEMCMRSLVLTISVLVCCPTGDDRSPESDGDSSCSGPCRRKACRGRRSRRGWHNPPDRCGWYDDDRHRPRHSRNHRAETGLRSDDRIGAGGGRRHARRAWWSCSHNLPSRKPSRSWRLLAPTRGSKISPCASKSWLAKRSRRRCS